MSREGAGAPLRWVAVAGVTGFLVSALFSSALRLPRGPFVLVYAVTVGALASRFFRRTGALVDAHVLMHGAAVFHGMEATAQLPPHY
jgi:hypothetical protein